MLVYPASLARLSVKAAELGVDLDSARRPLGGHPRPGLRPDRRDGGQRAGLSGEGAERDGVRRAVPVRRPAAARHGQRPRRSPPSRGGRRRRPPGGARDSWAGHGRRTTPRTRSCGCPERPRSMLIIGGGYVAAEFAHVFSAYGTRSRWSTGRNGCSAARTTRSPERFTELLRTTGRPAARTGRSNASSRPATVVSGCWLSGPSGEPEDVEADLLLIATGRVPNWRPVDVRPRRASRWTRTGWSSSTRSSEPRAEGVFALGDISSHSPAQARRQPRGPGRAAQPAAPGRP